MFAQAPGSWATVLLTYSVFVSVYQSNCSSNPSIVTNQADLKTEGGRGRLSIPHGDGYLLSPLKGQQVGPLLLLLCCQQQLGSKGPKEG